MHYNAAKSRSERSGFAYQTGAYQPSIYTRPEAEAIAVELL